MQKSKTFFIKINFFIQDFNPQQYINVKILILLLFIKKGILKENVPTFPTSALSESGCKGIISAIFVAPPNIAAKVKNIFEE